MTAYSQNSQFDSQTADKPKKKNKNKNLKREAESLINQNNYDYNNSDDYHSRLSKKTKNKSLVSIVPNYNDENLSIENNKKDQQNDFIDEHFSE